MLIVTLSEALVVVLFFGVLALGVISWILYKFLSAGSHKNESDHKSKALAEKEKQQELEREKTIKKQKDWAKKHPKASNFLSGISNRPLLVGLAIVLLFIAVLAVVFILLEK